MKELKVKSTPQTETTNGVASFPQKNLQATEEQIRYAKLSQLSSRDEGKIQEKMKEVSEITRKPPNVVSIALHDCSYDANLAIQNILEGLYDDPSEGEWITTKQTKKSKKAAATAQQTTTENPTEPADTNMDKLCNDFGPTEVIEEQKPDRLSRGIGRGGGRRGRNNNMTYSENWNEDKSPSGERSYNRDSSEKPFTRDRGRSNERGRGRGRGRAGIRNNIRGGRSRGRGFSRGRGSFRGSTHQNRGGFNRGRDANDRRQENENESNNNNNNCTPTPAEESWDLDPLEKSGDKVADWSEEIPNSAAEQTDWSKDEPEWGKGDSDWVKENESWSSKEDWGGGNQTPQPVEDIFSRPDVEWSQMNGHVNNQEVENWKNLKNNTPPKDNRLQYLPENIDTAVICSIPNSSSNGDASYQPNEDLSRYNPQFPSNQLPAGHPDPGLTNTLNDRAFSSNSRVPDDIALQRSIASMPMVSGVTESHKLEQEQIRTTKTHNVHKLRKGNRYVNLPSQPVVMPRSAQMVNDVGEQFAGLEFGSGPVSPRAAASTTATLPLVEFSNVMSSKCHDLTSSAMTEMGSARHQGPPPPPSLGNEPLISHTSTVLSQSSIITVTTATQIDASSQLMAKTEVLKTPPGFKSLDQKTSHYLGSPSRAHTHLTPEPIPFPSNSGGSPETSIDVFSRNLVLGTSVVTEQQPATAMSSQCNVYDQQPNDINTDNMITNQKALVEQQYLTEQQQQQPLVLNEQNDRTRPVVVDQKPFSEEKPQQVQSKLINSPMKPKDPQIPNEDHSRTDRLSDHPEQQQQQQQQQRTSMPPNARVSLSETQQNLSAKVDAVKLSKSGVAANNIATQQSKPHGSSPVTNQMNNIPKSYSSNELLNNLTSTAIQTTTKTQSLSGKSSNVPPGVLPMNLYAGVQPGMMPMYQQQTLPGYSYDDLLQMGRVPMPPYTYDVSMFPAVAPPASARESVQGYQGTNSKFSRGTDDSSTVNIPQGTAHVAPNNMPTQQQAAYMNATGQLPYGYTYAYQPNVLPQGGVYPFTTQSVYQMTQMTKGTQYQTQFQSAHVHQSFNSRTTNSHESTKSNFHHTNASGQAVALAALSKGSQQNSTSTSSLTTIQSGPGTGYKSQYTPQDGKVGYSLNSPTSLTAQQQHGQHMHNPAAAAAAAHLGNVNPHYLVQQHTNLSSHSGQQLSASHLAHQQIDVASHSHRSQVHQMPFAANRQKRDTKATYYSNWLGNQ